MEARAVFRESSEAENAESIDFCCEELQRANKIMSLHN